ncbi:MAG: hypothetical protein Q8M92_02920, partial [Candidatus Subteraquimicrobiales bacterium]|nr:hypothetical protein [Candidatus Subteraquimicrobiales bacterium]
FFRESTTKYQGIDDKGHAKVAERSFINIRGQLKKRLLPLLLQRKVTDYARIKYVVIDEIISEKGEELDLPITLRSKRQLAVLIADGKIPVDVDDYLDIDELRTDIMEYQQDPEAFNRDKKRRDKRRGEERSFIEMNNLSETLPPVKKLVGGGVSGGSVGGVSGSVGGGIADL